MYACKHLDFLSNPFAPPDTRVAWLNCAKNSAKYSQQFSQWLVM